MTPSSCVGCLLYTSDAADSGLISQKQHIIAEHPAKQAYKIWCKNAQALPSYQILGVGSFLAASLYERMLLK